MTFGLSRNICLPFPAAKILPSAAFCYIFYSRSESKKTLSARKNIGFYHVLRKKPSRRNVAQQKSENGIGQGANSGAGV